jgi:hypothetical protein
VVQIAFFGFYLALEREGEREGERIVSRSVEKYYMLQDMALELR